MKRVSILKLIIEESNPNYSTMSDKNEQELKDLLLHLLMFPNSNFKLNVEVTSVRDTPEFPKTAEVDNLNSM